MRKRCSIMSILLICIIAIGIISYVNFSKKISSDTIERNQENNSEINISSIRNIDGKAKIIKNVCTPKKLIALSFEGVQDDEIMKQILDLLESYSVKSTFIITGIDSAENPEIIKEIKDDEHELGSGTLSSDSKEMDNLSEEELLKNFSKSNKIIEEITGEKSNLIKCKGTDYTDKVLEAAYGSGFQYVLENNEYLNHQSFENYEQVHNYIRRVKNGTILSIKLNGVLDESEYSKEKNEEKPSIDKKAGIDAKDEDKDEISIVQTVEWILKALKENKKEVVKVTSFSDMQQEEGDILQEVQLLYTTNTKVAESYYKNNILKSLNSKSSTNKNSKAEDKNSKNPNINRGDNHIIEDKTSKMDFNELIEKNNKKLAQVNSYIYTIQNSVSYTFRGLSDERTLDSTLEALKSINAKGTFFVTKDDIKKYPERIKKILSYGNEIGNGGITSSSKLLSKSTEDICKEIYEVDAMLREIGVNTKAYMPGYGYVNSNIQEAVSSLNQMDEFKGYEIFTYSKSPITTQYTNWSANEIVQNYFDTNTYLSLRKGEIVYYRLDSGIFSNSDTIGDIIKILTKNYVDNGYIHRYNTQTKLYELVQKPLGYSVVPIREIQNNKHKRYEINAASKVLIPRSNAEVTKFIKNNYIGNMFVDLNGFTESEQNQIDKDGTINTNGTSAVFLTFDDWGSDVIINEILQVLKKHNVNGCFFVIGQYIDPSSGISNANPNLLRTIAAYGHDIGSHNYNHETLETDRDKLMSSLSQSYAALSRVAGDLGTVKPYFRPPTLYVNKSGMESVFETGYDYIVNGNISTHDYETGSADELLSLMEDGLEKNKGNIFIMHMNNQAYYTPEALDKFLTNNEQGKYGDVYKIAKLSDYLK